MDEIVKLETQRRRRRQSTE